MLLEAGANINHQNKVCEYTTHTVSAQGSVDALHYSSNPIYTPPQWGGTAVYHASSEGHSKVVKLLVQAGANLELHTAVHDIFMPWT